MACWCNFLSAQVFHELEIAMERVETERLLALPLHRSCPTRFIQKITFHLGKRFLSKIHDPFIFIWYGVSQMIFLRKELNHAADLMHPLP